MIESIIIVGSGAAGVSTALGITKNGIKPLVLDVGKEPKLKIMPKGSIFNLRKKENVFDLMIGDNFQGLSNMIENKSYPPKLTAPYTNYISESANQLSPIINKGFTPIQSFAKGGLASGWGAGTYEYNDHELKNLPICADDLVPYYKILNQEIGVSGTNDDLSQYFGKTQDLQSPINLSKKSLKLLSNYKKNSKKFNKHGVSLGYPRLAVLTEPHKGRNALDYSNNESWYPNLPYIYNPAFTLKNLIEQDKVKYRDSILVIECFR